MLLRANTLAKGYSGARVETIELLVSMLGAGLLPYVPSPRLRRGERRPRPAGAPCAAARRRGEAWSTGERLPGDEALRAAGLEPIELAAKEGLSLINGTQFMTAMATLGLVRADGSRDGRPRVRAVARGAAGLADELSSHDPCGAAAARAGRVRRERAARCSRGRRSSSRIAGATRCRTPTRCAARRRCTARAATSSTRRANGRGRAQRGDRQPARAPRRGADRLERQLPRTADRVRARRARDRRAPSWRASASVASSAWSTRASPTACRRSSTREGGLNSGFMIPQYVAARSSPRTSRSAIPASVDSIPTSAGQEDHVSMGNAAGLKALQVARERRARARDRAARRRPGRRVPRAARARCRCSCDPRRSFGRCRRGLRDDRPLSADIERVATGDP